MTDAQQPQDVVPQQQQGQAPVAAVSLAVNSVGENLQCQWQNCGERCSSAEALYVSQFIASRHQLLDSQLTVMIGACLRKTRRSQVDQQPQLDLSMGQLQDDNSQARPHHLTYQSPCSTQTAQV